MASDAEWMAIVGQEVEKLKASCAKLERERDEAREDRNARRQSLAQEIRETLATRSYWAPSDPADIISAVGLALSKAGARADELERERDEARDKAGIEARIAKTALGAVLQEQARNAELTAALEAIYTIRMTAHANQSDAEMLEAARDIAHRALGNPGNKATLEAIEAVRNHIKGRELVDREIADKARAAGWVP